MVHGSGLPDGSVPSQLLVLHVSAGRDVGAAGPHGVQCAYLRVHGTSVVHQVIGCSAAQAWILIAPSVGLCAGEELGRRTNPSGLLDHLHGAEISGALWYGYDTLLR